MSSELFVILIGLGAAANAVWFATRFASFAPQELKYGIVHLAAASLFAHTAVPLALTFAGQSMSVVLVAVFGVAYPALTYVLLAGLWMMKLAQGLLAGLR